MSTKEIDKVRYTLFWSFLVRLYNVFHSYTASPLFEHASIKQFISDVGYSSLKEFVERFRYYMNHLPDQPEHIQHDRKGAEVLLDIGAEDDLLEVFVAKIRTEVLDSKGLNTNDNKFYEDLFEEIGQVIKKHFQKVKEEETVVTWYEDQLSLSGEDRMCTSCRAVYYDEVCPECGAEARPMTRVDLKVWRLQTYQ